MTEKSEASEQLELFVTSPPIDTSTSNDQKNYPTDLPVNKHGRIIKYGHWPRIKSTGGMRVKPHYAEGNTPATEIGYYTPG